MSTETKKHTAVEWFASELSGHLGPSNGPELLAIFNQAIAMEKEQIVKAVYDSMGTNFDPNMGRAELYYDETYGKGNI
jgi:hypothetical protein